jgi:hypothetical protein
MADPFGLASGTLALATLAFQSSISLYEMVNSFHPHPQRARDLLGELEAFNAVLASLVDLVKSTSDIDRSMLDLPLLRCDNAWKNFQQEILQCVSRSSSNRDWATLTCMGDEFDDFCDLLARSKTMINIALTDATL